MPHPFEALSHDRYDLLVIGGGIHGLFAAYDAASRGLTVALVDRADFGSGLSFNHQRTIHGGLRALEGGHLAKARQHIVERRAWARMAPHLLRPLPFLIGTYHRLKRSRLMLRAGFVTYDLIGRHRNADVPPELHLPKARLESRTATRRLFPGVAERGLTGGAIWYDYQTRHPDRLTWTVALAGRRVGVDLLNYAAVVGALRSGSRVAGARVRDAETGQERDIEAACTLIAAGSQVAAVQQLFGVSDAPPLARAMNLLLDHPARDIATAAPSPAGRMLTAVPWRGYVLVGTHQSPGLVDPASAANDPSSATLIDECLAEVRSTFPTLPATRDRVRFVHYGLAPAVGSNGRADFLPDARVIRHASAGTPGLISLIGVKYTTARLAAEHAVDTVFSELKRPVGRCRTAAAALPHAGIADVEGRLVETLRALDLSIDRDVLEHLTSWYGTEASDVVRHASARHQLDRLSDSSAVLTGEVSYAVQNSQARRLGDAVLRRTALGSAGHPGQPALARAAAVMAAELNWTAERVVHEIADVARVYPSTSATGR